MRETIKNWISVVLATVAILGTVAVVLADAFVQAVYS